MRKPTALVLMAALLAGAGWFLASPRSGVAEDRPYELRFVSLTGEGSATKAWFEGAPPSGMEVQEALDRFVQQGFRLASQAPAWRGTDVTVSSGGPPGTTTTAEPAWVLFLERGRR